MQSHFIDGELSLTLLSRHQEKLYVKGFECYFEFLVSGSDSWNPESVRLSSEKRNISSVGCVWHRDLFKKYAVDLH